MAAWSRRIAIACCIAACGGVWFTADGCTRAVYLGPDDMVVTGRTMDWKEDPQSNIYFFPRGIERRGGLTDNFATVDEAVAELGKETFRIDNPDLPNGAKSTLHLSISDSTGNSAIFEYIDGSLVIHHGRDCQVMTNSPSYDRQQTLDDYWNQIGGLRILTDKRK